MAVFAVWTLWGDFGGVGSEVGGKGGEGELGGGNGAKTVSGFAFGTLSAVVCSSSLAIWLFFLSFRRNAEHSEQSAELLIRHFWTDGVGRKVTPSVRDPISILTDLINLSNKIGQRTILILERFQHSPIKAPLLHSLEGILGRLLEDRIGDLVCLRFHPFNQVVSVPRSKTEKSTTTARSPMGSRLTSASTTI